MQQIQVFVVGAFLVAHAVGLRLVHTERGTKCHPADADMHTVFSTGCNAYQHWQAEVLLNSAKHVGQCGKMTRIVVGCEMQAHHSAASTGPSGAADRIVEHSELLQSTHPNVHVVIAPAVAEAQKFPWYNKPWSFHWFVMNNTLKERAYAIIDPDEFFIMPLTQRGGRMHNDQQQNHKAFPKLTYKMDMKKTGLTDVVKPGMAVAQKYGMGDSMITSIDKTTICPGKDKSPCAKVTTAMAREQGASGPPYILHRDDFKKVMPRWFELMKPVLKITPGDILTDMYAYSFAAFHENVHHTLFDNYMVSNAGMDPKYDEAWEMIDDINSMSCHNPEQSLAGKELPTFLHAASHFKACSKGEQPNGNMHDCSKPESDMWNFHKGHVPANILECDHPLLMEPPEDLFNVQKLQKNERGWRGAFMICNFIHMINRAALEHKEQFCKSGFNQKKCTRLVMGDDHKRHGQHHEANPWEYPLAVVDVDCCPECEELAKK